MADSESVVGSPGIRIRAGCASDVASLEQRQIALLGEAFPLADKVDRPGEYLVLVAELAEQTIGHIAAGPVNLDPRRFTYSRARRKIEPATVPWWKINSLAVDAPHQGAGTGRALLKALLEQIPSRLIGLYGAVDVRREASLAWYRRQGFYLSPMPGLTEREGDSHALVALQTVPGEVFFLGYTRTLREHLRGAGHPRFAERLALQDFRLKVKNRQQVDPARGDTGYRQLARRLGARTDLPGCVHTTMGPRPLFVLAWDPDLHRVCAACQLERAEAIKDYDAEDHCDGCGTTQPDVRLSWAADEDSLFIVAAGLCVACRTQLP